MFLFCIRKFKKKKGLEGSLHAIFPKVSLLRVKFPPNNYISNRTHTKMYINNTGVNGLFGSSFGSPAPQLAWVTCLAQDSVLDSMS